MKIFICDVHNETRGNLINLENRTLFRAESEARIAQDYLTEIKRLERLNDDMNFETIDDQAYRKKQIDLNEVIKMFCWLLCQFLGNFCNYSKKGNDCPPPPFVKKNKNCCFHKEVSLQWCAAQNFSSQKKNNKGTYQKKCFRSNWA